MSSKYTPQHIYVGTNQPFIEKIINKLQVYFNNTYVLYCTLLYRIVLYCTVL